jgi:hypothetical protein
VKLGREEPTVPVQLRGGLQSLIGLSLLQVPQ